MAQQQDFPYVLKEDPWSSHSTIFQFLCSFPPGTKVLDVGTATGLLGEKCKGKGYILKGIEPNPTWVEFARQHYDEILISKLNEVSDHVLENNDVVVCADVLEHMATPEKELMRLVSLQNDGTVFLLSVPNIANVWIRINLLLGKFDYTDRGILDRTHLVFYTRSTFLEMIETSGLTVDTITVTPIPLHLVNEFFLRNRFGWTIYHLFYKITKLFPTVLGYQFVLRAVKKAHE
jgi:2-polyprenyl-3-methyl-5-hydroxy-6-metoxy-1,4-benzoquinol methylase